MISKAYAGERFMPYSYSLNQVTTYTASCLKDALAQGIGDDVQLLSTYNLPVVWSGLHDGNEVVVFKLPYSWGVQPAAHYVVCKQVPLGFVIIEEAKGQGDTTPSILTRTPSIKWTCDLWEDIDANHMFGRCCAQAALAEKGELLKNMIRKYRMGHNPLPRLRRLYEGKWQYFSRDSEWFRTTPSKLDIDENTFVFDIMPAGGDHGYVVWKPVTGETK